MHRVILFVGIILLIASQSHAAPRKSKPPAAESNAPTVQERLANNRERLYQEGKALSDAENYAGALTVFEDGARQYPTDPDMLNMLAFCQRKTGKLEEALANYHKALALKPDFPEAREYLGEAYIQAALKEIATLRSYGAAGAEELADVVEEFKEAAEGL